MFPNASTATVSIKARSIKARLATGALSAALAVLTPGLAAAETLDLSLGSDSAGAALGGPLRSGRANAAYDLGFLYSDDRDVGLKQAHAGLLVTGDAGARDADVNAGLGVRAVAADFDSGSGGAVDLGGKVEIRIPNFNRLGITAYAWYAPEIISFGDFDQNTEFGVMLDYEVIRDAALFVGYREIRFELDDADEDKVDDSIIAGLRLEF